MLATEYFDWLKEQTVILRTEKEKLLGELAEHKQALHNVREMLVGMICENEKLKEDIKKKEFEIKLLRMEMRK